MNPHGLWISVICWGTWDWPSSPMYPQRQWKQLFRCCFVGHPVMFIPRDACEKRPIQGPSMQYLSRSGQFPPEPVPEPLASNSHLPAAGLAQEVGSIRTDGPTRSQEMGAASLCSSLPYSPASIYTHSVLQFPSASSKDQVGPLLPDSFPVSTWGFHTLSLVLLV